MTNAFVPDEFVVPLECVGPGFRLEPLGAQHNDRDYDAWMSSIDHIRTTPGFPDGSWPSEMSLEENLRDLVRHGRDFAKRSGFTYSVLVGDDVIGCVYIYPSGDAGYDADVRSWVRASQADMDQPLWQCVTDWLGRDWPFTDVDYVARA